MCLRYLVSFTAVVLFGLASHASPEAFRVCAEPDNLPLSQQATDSGYDIELARLLAKELNRPLEIKWIAQRDHSYFAQTLGKGNCDALLDVPTDFKKVTTTRPWYRTGFVFITRKETKSPDSFDAENLRSMKIGVPSTGLGETPPALALTKRGLAQNLRAYSIYEPAQLIHAVSARDVDAAIVWGPFGGWFAQSEKTALAVTPTPDHDGDLALAYDMSIGVRKGNTRLRDQLNTIIERNRSEIATILKKWRVPLRGA